MLWTVSGTRGEGEAISAVAESDTSAEAEYMALRRGIVVRQVAPASNADVKAARAANLLWKYTRRAAHMCFGRPVGGLQLACLLTCGLLTMVMLLGRR